jgi:hypothetical protein
MAKAGCPVSKLFKADITLDATLVSQQDRSIGEKIERRNVMSKMRVVQVTHAGGPFELFERKITEPGVGHVRIKVDACGVCHSDTVTKEGTWSGIQYPRVPGHEIAGIVDAVGEGVAGWTQGQRVGVG